MYAVFPPCSILQELDQTIDKKDTYVKQKEEHIAALEQILTMNDISADIRYATNTKLYEEYLQFKPDSAILLMQENLDLAEQTNNRQWKDESMIKLASLYSVGGLYLDAEQLLDSINPATLPTSLRIVYYDVYKQLFAFYPATPMSKTKYRQYRDSLLANLDPASNNYKIVYSETLTEQGKTREARDVLLPMFEKETEDTHWRAMLAFAIGETYRMENDYDGQKKYYAISAIGDIKNVIKENASLRSLGMAFYKTGHVERAYRYVQQSMADAVFSNARMRTMEVSQVFPIIEQSFREKIFSQSQRRFYLLVCVGVLSFFLVLAIVYVYIQLKRLNRFQCSLSAANKQLHDLNKTLQSTNRALSEANLLKETYISQFLDICSMYIDKLEKYQHSLNRKALERDFEGLCRTLKSKDMIENEVKELYATFDHIFLHLYPHFVEEFNALLLPDERFNLKTNDLLNTELRIFALMRLGISDSSKIAAFLRYSATTIYNYRTRVRNKSAVPRDEFENYVMKIGSVSS